MQLSTIVLLLSLLEFRETNAQQCGQFTTAELATLCANIATSTRPKDEFSITIPLITGPTIVANPATPINYIMRAENLAAYGQRIFFLCRQNTVITFSPTRTARFSFVQGSTTDCQARVSTTQQNFNLLFTIPDATQINIRAQFVAPIAPGIVAVLNGLAISSAAEVIDIFLSYTLGDDFNVRRQTCFGMQMTIASSTVTTPVPVTALLGQNLIAALGTYTAILQCPPNLDGILTPAPPTTTTTTTTIRTTSAAVERYSKPLVAVCTGSAAVFGHIFRNILLTH